MSEKDHSQQNEKPTDLNQVLGSVIEILHDGHRGLVEIAKYLQDHETKQLFLRESQARAEFAAELENELHRQGTHDVNEGGTALGAIRRGWSEIKAHLGGGDHTLLVTAEKLEDTTKEKYAESLQEKLPGNARDLLLRQQRHVMEFHDRVRALRDAQAA